MKVVIVQIFLLISSNLQQKSSTFDRDRPLREVKKTLNGFSITGRPFLFCHFIDNSDRPTTATYAPDRPVANDQEKMEKLQWK